MVKHRNPTAPQETHRIHEVRALMTLEAMLQGTPHTVERPIRPEARFIDIVVAFGESVPSFFGFLADELACRSVIFEVYSKTPQPIDLRVCAAKVVELEISEFRASEDGACSKTEPPMLVVVSTGKPARALDQAKSLTETNRAGVYRAHLLFGVKVTLIDIKRLQGDGVGGYKALGHANYLKREGISALVGDPRISQDEKNLFRETMMKFDDTYGTDYTQHTVTSAFEQGREEGREEGRRAALEMAELLLGSVEGLDQILDLSELRAEIRRRHAAQARH